MAKLIALSELQFENTLQAALPGDQILGGGPRQVHAAAFSRVQPRGFDAPKTLAVADEVASMLGLDPELAAGADFAEVFSGSRLLPGMDPYALCYGGHQFGNWAGQLGDGRAINLGQVRGVEGHRLVLQLKGAGPTPYSRRGDGFAVLRSSVREFLCSEAMHHLGVPTTRALSLVATGADVMRDMFYDGNARLEPGAVVCRVSRSFLRIGSFELPAARGESEMLSDLLGYCLREYHPDWEPPAKGEAIPPSMALDWFEWLASKSADMVVHWMRVGFVHGVLNTDNLSVLGETIDYGPYGWLEDYDEGWTPNTTDAQGKRYRFGNQAAIVHWNLVRLASAIVPLVGDVEGLQAIIDAWPASYESRWQSMMQGKLGLVQEPEDKALIQDLGPLLAAAETDMTLFFRALAKLPLGQEQGPSAEDVRAAFAACHYQSAEFDGPRVEALQNWCQRYARCSLAQGVDDIARAGLMNQNNPLVVLRNYLAQLAIDRAEKGDPGGITDLLEALRHPYEDRAAAEPFSGKRPEWARHRPGCSMLSCSS